MCVYLLRQLNVDLYCVGDVLAIYGTKMILHVHTCM